MLIFLLEAAFRSLLMAAAVWAGIRMMRVQAVLAQKVAWVLVLLAAGTMPLVMRAPFLALDRALQIPVQNLRSAASNKLALWLKAPAPAKRPQSPVSADIALPVPVNVRLAAPIPKPSAGHTSLRSSAPQRASESPIMDSGSLSVLKASSSTDSAEILAGSTSRLHPATVLGKPESRYWTAARIRSIAFAAYLTIGAVFLLRMVAGLSIAFRLWRRATPVNELDPVMFSIAGQTGSRVKHPKIRVSTDLSTPVTIGSSIILPADSQDWDEAKLRVVLAHEQSHVRQGDFYLQLIAALHVAVFWFSPLGWWLQRKLSELGEALSDRAGLEQASSPASYAQILLEFAAMPRRSPLAGALAGPLTGVAMARTSNLSSRIERVLNDRRFRLAFLGGRRHAFVAAILVPAALCAAVGMIRIAPAVKAAQADKVAPVIDPKTGVVTGNLSLTTQETGKASDAIAGQIAVVSSDADSADILIQEAPPAPAIAPTAPNPPDSDLAPPAVPETSELQAPDAPPPPPGKKHGSHVWISSGDHDGDNFAIVHENGDGTLRWNGEYNEDLAKVRKKMNLKGDYIWFERDGKSYIITDPAILAQAQEMFKGDPQLERQMKALEMQQAEWEKKMALLEPEMEKIKVPGPEFAEKMAKLNAQLAELQSDKFKKMTDQMSEDFSQEKLAELQEKIGEIQERVGEIQGEIGEQQGRIGEKQGEIGEKMGELGEKMGRIGELEGQHAEEASRKFRSVLDQAFKDGKAKPVE